MKILTQRRSLMTPRDAMEAIEVVPCALRLVDGRSVCSKVAQYEEKKRRSIDVLCQKVHSNCGEYDTAMVHEEAQSRHAGTGLRQRSGMSITTAADVPYLK